MTCIVAIEDGEAVYVGTDSFFGDAKSVVEIDRPKWLDRGPVRILWCGSMRAAQAVANAKPWRLPRRNEDDLAYLQSVVADGVRRAHKAADVDFKDSEFILAFNGKAWVLQEDYSVYRVRHGYYATGAGGQVAMGALAATQGTIARHAADSVKARVRVVLEFSERHCPQVRRPFHIERVAA